jgi:hypothetical protein
MLSKIRFISLLVVLTFFVVVGLFFAGCGQRVTLNDRVIYDPATQNDPNKVDKAKTDLKSALETAISTMENWEKLTPERRQSIIDSLKSVTSENK